MNFNQLLCNLTHFTKVYSTFLFAIPSNIIKVEQEVTTERNRGVNSDFNSNLVEIIYICMNLSKYTISY